MTQATSSSRFRDRIPGHILFLLQVVLVLLWAFPQCLQPGTWGQWLGRWHPLLVHFPIALLLLLVVTWIFRKAIGEAFFRDGLFNRLLWWTAIMATLTALSGYSLGTEEGYPDDLLQRHRQLGTLTALLAAVLWWICPSQPGQNGRTSRPRGNEVNDEGSSATTLHLDERGQDQHHPSMPEIIARKNTLFTLLLTATAIVLILAGHYGGSLTHGEGYLLPTDTDSVRTRQVTDSTPVFEAAVQPILESKCYGCHNPGKQKGGLDMTAVEALLKGGKHGVLWVSGDPLGSLMVQRALLEMGDRKHMPPQGKPQLSPAELELIQYWIKRGADMHIRFRDLPEQDSLRQMASALIPDRYTKQASAKVYTFAAPDPSLLEKLRHPYRSIQPLYQGSTAYAISFFLPQYFRQSMLDECLPLSANIVSLNLANMPVNDSIWKSVSQFRELEQLNLSGTPVRGKGIEAIQTLQKLQVLTLTDTRIDPQSLLALRQLPALTKVYLARTGTDSAVLQRLAKANPRITWIIEQAANANELLQLTGPQLSVPDKRIFGQQEKLTLTHPMKGVQIRYRTDGQEPDSLQAPRFTEPIVVDRPMLISTRAVMEGWLASPVRSFQVYPSGIQPLSQTLMSDPDPRYKSQGAASFFDQQTGEPGNLMVNWLGYRQSAMKVMVRMPEDQQSQRIILSTALNTYSYVFPPEQVLVRLARDSGRWEAEARLRPGQPVKHQPVGNLPLVLKLPDGHWKYLEITVVPLPSLPAWHDGRKQKGWVFVDEIIID